MSEFVDSTSMNTERVMKLKEMVEAEGDRLKNRMDMMSGVRLMIDEWLEMTVITDKQQTDISALRQQLEDEKQRRAELEMKLAEMSKLTTGMAKKASEEAMLKALRTYANRSKRKTADKRAYAKTAILEIANVNSLVLPDDLAAIVESLDDDQTEPKVVNVSGNYNDIHENGEVKVKG